MPTPSTFFSTPISLCLIGMFAGLMPRAAGGPAPGAPTAFQHANLRTPRWLGYFVQRPESHSLHHEREVHRDNYSDLPVFDMIFGSFRNPARYAADTGFWQGVSSRVADMLLPRDVSTRPTDRR